MSVLLLTVPLFMLQVYDRESEEMKKLSHETTRMNVSALTDIINMEMEKCEVPEQ